MFEFTEILTG